MTESYSSFTQSIDKVEFELDKLDDISSKYEKAILNIEDLKVITQDVTVMNPKTNLGYIIQNQARLIKNLPELHALSMKRYMDRFESCFTESVMLAKSIVENNKCITYLKNLVKQTEEQAKKVEVDANEDMALLKLNSKRHIAVYETRIEKMLKKEQIDMMSIVDLKKELEVVKAEAEAIVSGVNKGIKDVAAYLQMHATILSGENSVIKGGNREDERVATLFSETVKTVGQEIRGSLANLIGELRGVRNSIADEGTQLNMVAQTLKAVDYQERAIIKQEMENFKRSLFNIKNLILGDNQSIKDTIVQLRLFVDQLGRNTDSIAQEFERQVNRFISLSKRAEIEAKKLEDQITIPPQQVKWTPNKTPPPQIKTD